MEFKRFETLYAMMEEAFPPEKLRIKQGQKRLLEHPCYRLLTAENGEELVGFLAYWELESCRFIEQVAVKAKRRGNGVGTLLLQQALKGIAKPILLEIELPEDPQKERVLALHQRLGFVLNDWPYQQPPLKEGLPARPMGVMSHQAPMGNQKFMPYKKEIYLEVYGQRQLLL